ncbi:MAG: DUF4091 domain-containing protein [Clostridia bacterium]|nr:DUF4091 domain-containing protein [Clostridia bacterium]
MNNQVKIKVISSLEKLYNNESVPSRTLTKFAMLKNEKKSFQVVVESENEFNAELFIKSNFNDIRIYTIEHIKSDFPMNKTGADDYFRFSDDSFYPDLLLPINEDVSINKGINVFWVEINADESLVGNNPIEIFVKNNNNVLISTNIVIEVIDYKLDFNNFIYTNWFHTDCLMSHYGFEAFSDEYWRVTENFLKTANEYGMNCVLTPIFTPPLDTEIGKERPTVQLVDIAVDKGVYSFNFDKLTKWIEMGKRCGILYFEMAHFFTQWGARHAPKIMATVDGEYKKIFGWETKATSKEYKKFLTDFSIEFKKYIESRNLKNHVLIHVSDEPNFSMIIPYAKASKLIHKLYKGYKIVDALSDVWFYKLGIVSNPIPSNDHIHNFIDKSDDLWTYYCSAQNKKCVSNRFFCNDSIRTRVIGYQMYKYDISGFLHWGYNFYYTQLSKAVIDPYKVSDAGGKFPSGDSYIVYPAEDGTAHHSIRLKVFYDALQDMAALNALEKLTNKEECLKIIEEDKKYSITFSDYPHSEEWLLNTREEINKKIKENIK